MAGNLNGRNGESQQDGGDIDGPNVETKGVGRPGPGIEVINAVVGTVSTIVGHAGLVEPSKLNKVHPIATIHTDRGGDSTESGPGSTRGVSGSPVHVGIAETGIAGSGQIGRVCRNDELKGIDLVGLLKVVSDLIPRNDKSRGGLFPINASGLSLSARIHVGPKGGNHAKLVRGELHGRKGRLGTAETNVAVVVDVDNGVLRIRCSVKGKGKVELHFQTAIVAALSILGELTPTGQKRILGHRDTGCHKVTRSEVAFKVLLAASVTKLQKAVLFVL